MIKIPVYTWLGWPNFAIESYRLMAYIATLVGIYVIYKFAKKEKLSPKHAFYMSVVSTISMLIFARFFFYFGPWTWGCNCYMTLWERFINFLNFFGSGLVMYGGSIGIVLGFVTYCKIKKLDVWKYADVFSIGMSVTLAIARWGCFLSNDSCRGAPTDVPWAIIRTIGDKVVNAAHHPAPIYASINAFILFGILLYIRKRKPFDGFLMIFTFIYYGTTRFIMEFLRNHNWFFYGLSASQLISIAIVTIGVIGYIYRRHKVKKQVKPESEIIKESE